MVSSKETLLKKSQMGIFLTITVFESADQIKLVLESFQDEQGKGRQSYQSRDLHIQPHSCHGFFKELGDVSANLNTSGAGCQSRRLQDQPFQATAEPT